MLTLSDEIKEISASFFQYRNDIDIFTEDKQSSKEFYITLFKRLLANTGIIINDVTPLGSKDDVIFSCTNSINNNRKKLYIVDGDVNIIDDSYKIHPDLFVLKAYCIENFIIDIDSVINYIYMSCGTQSVNDIRRKLSYRDWLEIYSEKLVDLFLHFCLMNQLELRYILYNANKYINKGFFEKSLVDDDIASLKNEILKHVSSHDYDRMISQLRMRWEGNLDNLLVIVSGKDYLIQIVLSKLIEFKNNGSKPSLDEAKMHLLLLSNLDRLEDLKARIVDLHSI